ncbi:uncharacterized protein LOC111916110 [Lactuca sativa]|uniref:uncharacterized protein LOC111916110 n=1 Tax=Lactuca sativa TaxID=4236 RepID=UPI0022AFA6DC|nr:uncharacterized protein LOC111916110 [Lactuca sativa]
MSATQATPSRYTGNLPKCNKCNFHRTGACREMHCKNCNRNGHTARSCKPPTQPISQVTATRVSQACYECGEVGNFKRNCPKIKNDGGIGRVLEIGYEEAVVDPNVVTDTFLHNNSYTCTLFDTDAEKSFVIHKFKHLLKQNPKAQKDTFTIEMDNGKTENSNDMYIGCTLTLNKQSFQIDLILVSIKSIDIIIGMDWLSLHHVDILCFEKAIRLNMTSNESIVIYGDKSGANLQLISSVKAQKYLRKDYCAFLAQVVDKIQEVKSIKDIPKMTSSINFKGKVSSPRLS